MQIVCKNLSFTYNPKAKFKKQALKNITLTIDEGEFYGIIGHTGSGKSTFIQHLNGLIPVQSGELKIGEFDLSAGVKKNKKGLKELRSKVGMVFQYPEYQLFADTVFDDVAFALKNFSANLSVEEVENEVKSALEVVGLDYYEIKDKSPFDLSGGQRRRVAIAGVLVMRPEVLVLDEPVAGLDPDGKKNLMKILHSLHSSFVKTIIIVSHDMDEVVENCSRVAVFSEGELVLEDTPENLFKNGKMLDELRLDVPVTAYLVEALKGVKVDIETDFKTEDFIKKVVEKYREIKG